MVLSNFTIHTLVRTLDGHAAFKIVVYMFQEARLQAK